MYVSTSTTLLIWETIAYIDGVTMNTAEFTHVRNVDSRPVTSLAPDAYR